MTTDITEVQLKNGQHMKHMKSDGKHFFFGEAKFLSRLQLYLIIFILLTSMIMSAYLMLLMTEGFNRLLTVTQVLDYKVNALLNNQSAMLVLDGNT